MKMVTKSYRSGEKKKFGGKNFKIVTAHSVKSEAQKYAAKRRKLKKELVRVSPVIINGKKVHGIWVRKR
jgi:hypothetical protein